jgi:hypothetical protein
LPLMNTASISSFFFSPTWLNLAGYWARCGESLL